MASKKKDQPAQHCQIATWLEGQDAQLAQMIEHLCLSGILRPRGGRGVTFLYPEDRKYREEIVSKGFGQEANEAAELIEALVLPDVFRTAADFSSRPVGSVRGVKLAVESAEPQLVRLAGGVELAPAESFQLLVRSGREPRPLAVWRVVKGRLPTTGEAFAPPPPRRRAKGGGPQGLALASGRAHLAAKTACEFDRCMRQDGCRGYNPYLARSVSLLRYLELKHPAELVKVLPLIDYDPLLTFYLLLEPANPKPRLLADEILFGEGAWNGASLFENAPEDYLAVFRGLPGRREVAAVGLVRLVFADRAKLGVQADRVRQEIARIESPWRMQTAMRRAFEVLAAQNEVGGLGPALPASTLEALGASGLIWQAEMRFTVRLALLSLARDGGYSSYTFGKIVEDLRTVWSGKDYEADLRLMNAGDLKLSVAPRPELILLQKLLCSTDFLYFPAAPSAVGPASGDPWDPTKWYPYFNASAFALEALQATGRSMARPAGIGEKALLELQAYVGRHGALPPQVQALAAGAPRPTP